MPQMQPKAPTPSVNRMTLTSVVRQRTPAPARIVLSGPEGVGKSTFGAEAPGPVFIAAEDGIRYLGEVPAFPEPQTLKDVHDAIAELTNGEHDFKTLVIDTVDFVEPLIHAEVCRRDQATSIEAVGGGYGKGYSIALEEWRLMLGRLDKLREKRDMGIVLLGHSQTANFDNPSGANYTRYELAMNKKAALVIKAWADVVLFANFETATTDPKRGKVKGISTGRRVIYTQRTAAFDAKNRMSLPEILPLSYQEFSDALAAGLQVDAGEVLKACRDLIKSLELPETHAAVKYVETQKDNPSALVKALNRLRALSDEAGKEKE